MPGKHLQLKIKASGDANSYVPGPESIPSPSIPQVQMHSTV